MSLQRISKRLARVVLIPALFLSVAARSFGTSITLEGQNKGDTNTWVSGNLKDWQELDYIPCRVHWSGAQGSNQVIEIDFEHRNNGNPGIQNLFDFTTSSNVVLSVPPKLFAPPTASTWSYSFTVDILDGQDAYVFFSARIAADQKKSDDLNAAVKRSAAGASNKEAQRRRDARSEPQRIAAKVARSQAAQRQG